MTHRGNLLPKCEIILELNYKAKLQTESYPNLVSSTETQLGELVLAVVVFINLHRSPVIKSSCSNMAHFITKRGHSFTRIAIIWRDFFFGLSKMQQEKPHKDIKTKEATDCSAHL